MDTEYKMSAYSGFMIIATFGLAVSLPVQKLFYSSGNIYHAAGMLPLQAFLVMLFGVGLYRYQKALFVGAGKETRMLSDLAWFYVKGQIGFAVNAVLLIIPLLIMSLVFVILIVALLMSENRLLAHIGFALVFSSGPFLWMVWLHRRRRWVAAGLFLIIFLTAVLLPVLLPDIMDYREGVSALVTRQK